MNALRIVLAFSLLFCHQVAGQYRERLPHYIGEEDQPPLPPSTILDGKVVELNEIDDSIELRNSEAVLNCSNGRMDIRLAFKEPFNGIIYPNETRSSPCTVYGDGKRTLRVNLPLYGCGTHQGPARVFSNTINVRYHNQLTFDIDERLTVVCRFPPPIAPPPLAGLPFIADPPPAPVIRPTLLSGTNIIVIICAILFLALLLLGLGFGYACVKRRRVSFIKHVPPPISSLSPSDLSQLSMPFDSLKIPRAHAIPMSDDSTLSEIIPSDYPSESLSELEQVDSAGPVVLAAPPNRSFITTEELLKTTYTDKTVREEMDIQRQPHLMIKQPSTQALQTSEQIFSTSLSSTQLHDSTEITRAPVNIRPHLHQADVHQSAATAASTKVPEANFRVHPPEHRATDGSTMSDTDGFFTEAESMVDGAVMMAEANSSRVTQSHVDDLIKSTVTETKIHEDIERRRRAVREYYARQQRHPPTDWDVDIRQYAPERTDTSSSHWEESSIGTDVAPIPTLTGSAAEQYRHNLRSEDRQRQQQRSHTLADTENEHTFTSFFSTSVNQTQNQLNTDLTVIEPPIRPTPRGPTPPRRPAVPSMDVLIRVLAPPGHDDCQEDCLSELTDDERATICRLLTHDQEFRSLFTESVEEQHFEHTVRSSRYARLLPPAKWNVIFRVVAPLASSIVEPEPSEFSETMSRATSDVTDYSEAVDNMAQRSQRTRRYGDSSGLAPVFESDVSQTQFHQLRSSGGSEHSFGTNMSSYRGDVRSVTEDTVSFRRYLTADEAASARQTLANRVNFVDDNWTDVSRDTSRQPTQASGEHSAASASRSQTVNTQYYGADSTLLQSRGVFTAPSTVGDREELYSVAETDVEWQRRHI